MKKRILFIADSAKIHTGYATVVRNIISNLDQNKYIFGQLGLSDISSKPISDLPIHYYSILKNHSGCCNKSDRIIEYVNPEYFGAYYYQINNNKMELASNQMVCENGKNHSTDNYGFESVYSIIEHFKPDIVIPINDIWGLYNISHIRNRDKFKLIQYLAVDSECFFNTLPSPNNGLPPINTINVIGSADRCVVFTDWAKNVLNKTCEIALDKQFNNISVIPHGIDNTKWKKLDNKIELREKWFNIKPNDNIFLIGSMNRNQSRKHQDLILKALRTFIDKYEVTTSKAMLYFHCVPNEPIGWDLPWLMKYYNLEDRVIFNKDVKPGLGLETEILNEIANTFDIHITLPNSEGWSLTPLETMAAGIPNISTKYSAHADWGKNNILFCKIAAKYHEPGTCFIKAIADTNDAAKQISLFYNSKKLIEDYSRRGISFTNSLIWEKIVKTYWEPLLESIDLSDLSLERWNQ